MEQKNAPFVLSVLRLKSWSFYLIRILSIEQARIQHAFVASNVLLLNHVFNFSDALDKQNSHHLQWLYFNPLILITTLILFRSLM
jgi:hypothetical protein